MKWNRDIRNTNLLFSFVITVKYLGTLLFKGWSNFDYLSDIRNNNILNIELARNKLPTLGSSGLNCTALIETKLKLQLIQMMC